MKLPDEAHDLHAEDLLRRRKEVFGKLYVVSLKDFYELIGEHSARIEDALRLMCQRAIEHQVGDRSPVTLELDGYFVFRFDEKDDAEGWEKAKAIVDEVGSGALGGRYHPSEHDPMVRIAVAAGDDVLDVRNEPEPQKLQTALEAVRDQPRDHVLIKWRSRAIEHDRRGENEWLDIGARRRSGIGKVVDKIKHAWRKRLGERRKHRLPWSHSERRHGLERRGRGY